MKYEYNLFPDEDKIIDGILEGLKDVENKTTKTTLEVKTKGTDGLKAQNEALIENAKDLELAARQLNKYSKATSEGRGKFLTSQSDALKNMTTNYKAYNKALRDNKAASTLDSLANKTMRWANSYESAGGIINSTNGDLKKSVDNIEKLNELINEQRSSKQNVKGYNYSIESFNATRKLIQEMADNGIDTTNFIDESGALKTLDTIKAKIEEKQKEIVSDTKKTDTKKVTTKNVEEF